MTTNPLGHDAIDAMHGEFEALLQKLAGADKAAFSPLFVELISHTQHHFDEEQRLMEESRFSSIQEHVGEHTKVLGELNQLAKRVKAGNTLMAKAYVRERLPEWFNLHSSTMDSALVSALAE